LRRRPRWLLGRVYTLASSAVDAEAQGVRIAAWYARAAEGVPGRVGALAVT
jgi:hypothetical protein